MPGVGLRPCISNEPPGDFGGPWGTVIIEGLDAQSRMNMNGWVRLPSSMHSSSREVEKPWRAGSDQKVRPLQPILRNLFLWPRVMEGCLYCVVRPAQTQEGC